ncbi:FkbM family methyltransferase [Frankia sp. Cpl3]|nr:FkbM family methyltransferase [Frankia sp. Cpl3]
MTSTLGHIWRHPAVQEERGRALGRYFGWQIWQRTARRPLTISLRGDIRLRCYPHRTSASAVLYCRLPEWHEMRFLLDHLHPGDTFVDVGANVGVYTLLAASIPGVRCIAFEPSTETWTRLVENVELNGLVDVDVRHAAVGAECGETAVTIGQDTINRVLDADGGAGVDGVSDRVSGVTPRVEGSERVPLTTLDDALNGVDRVALVKIDVEGMEPAVLRGAREVIRRHSPAMIIEYNDPDILHRMLSETGYKTFRYDPQRRRPVLIDPFRDRIQNVLALKETPGEPAPVGTASIAARSGEGPF